MRRLFSAGFFSFLALLLSVVALVIALTASDRAQDAVLAVDEAAQATASAAPSEEPSDEPSDEPSEEPSPFDTETVDPEPSETTDSSGVDGSSATPGPLDPPSAPYTVSREPEPLTIQNSRCNGTWYVDFDEMRVKPESDNAEVRYDGCSSEAELSFTSQYLAQVASPTASPEDCRESIRRAPSNSEVKASKGLTLCLVTDGLGGPEAAEQPRIARITVTTVNQDLSLNITATTWDIPT